MPSVERALRLIVAVLFLTPRADAQRIAPSGVVSPSALSRDATVTNLARAPAGSGERAISGGILGTFAGAAVGALSAFAITHGPRSSDHSMDGVVYLYFVPIGAAVGLLVGAIVGGVTHD